MALEESKDSKISLVPVGLNYAGELGANIDGIELAQDVIQLTLHILTVVFIGRWHAAWIALMQFAAASVAYSEAFDYSKGPFALRKGRAWNIVELILGVFGAMRLLLGLSPLLGLRVVPGILIFWNAWEVLKSFGVLCIFIGVAMVWLGESIHGFGSLGDKFRKIK